MLLRFKAAAAAAVVEAIVAIVGLPGLGDGRCGGGGLARSGARGRKVAPLSAIMNGVGRGGSWSAGSRWRRREVGCVGSRYGAGLVSAHAART